MASLAAKVHVDAAGRLTVQVPDELRNTDVQARVTVLPLDAGPSGDWEEYEHLMEDIRRRWPRDTSTAEILDEIRG